MKVEILQKKRIFDHFFKIDEVRLRHEKYDGSMSPPLTRFSFERGESVAVILHFPKTGEVALIEQYRYPAYSSRGGAWILEIVAGSVDREDPVESIASQEVLEETGYRVPPASLEKLSVFFASPGGTSERVHLFLATLSESDKKEEGGGKDSEAEDIRVIKIPLGQALKLLETGQIEDAKTMIALMLLDKRREANHEIQK